MIPRSELTAAQREIRRLKDHALHIESDLAKERIEAERVKALDKNKRLRDIRDIIEGMKND